MNTKSFTTSVLFSTLCALGINTSYAAIYKCTSSTGKVSYNGTRCSGTTTTQISTTLSAPTTTTISTTTTSTATTTSAPVPSSTTTTTSSTLSLATTTVTTTAALPTDAIFAPTSFWYTPIPTMVTLHTNSANFVAEFIRQKTAYYNNVNINTSAYSSPVYIADSTTPLKNIGFNNCQNKTYIDATLMSMLSGVPIPSYAQPSAGTDSEMTIYQPSTHTMWETWVTKKDLNGNWIACWGGKMTNTSTNAGIFQQYYGTTATGLPFIGGQVTAEELQRGEIKHAIGIAMVDVETYSIYSWPANRSDGYNPNNVPNRIAEGQRFRLDPSINVDLLPMTKAGKIIAKAAQKYGFVVWDKAGSVSIRAQNVISYIYNGAADPYPALFENTPGYAVLNGFPWDKLQFLPMNYGRP